MAKLLKIGQELTGQLGKYRVVEQIHRSVFLGRNAANEKVVVKTALDYLLQNEKTVLQAVHDVSSIRPLLDTTTEPDSLVLRHLDDDLLRVCCSPRQVPREDIKLVARSVLLALQAIHSHGWVHTDIKPDNVLVNYHKDSQHFSEVQLGDCGDVSGIPPDADPFHGPAISAAMFRSPEAMLNLRWRQPTDIWSFGATMISLIYGRNFHIFCPPASIDFESDDYPVQAFIKQISHFGPPPVKMAEIMDEDREEMLTELLLHVTECQLRKPFSMVSEKEISKNDKDFICRIMKFDPRDRPTATELLEDPWFQQD